MKQVTGVFVKKSMKNPNLLFPLLAMLSLLVVSACREDDVPLSGSLTVNLGLRSFPDGLVSYALFTESSYLSDKFLPLKTGTSAPVGSLRFNDLLPGTYVFVVYTANALPFTGQVVAGKETKITAG
jgi:hypothetical protein